MTKERASIFNDALEVDVSDFAVKRRADTKAPTREQVRVVTEAANFPSRESSPPTPKLAKKRAPRVYRTGRNVQFNAKVTQDTADAIYAITDANEGWVIGYTLERAVEALQRELEREKPRKHPTGSESP
jgi:hypothetical protein